jgi:hypothetical protein
VPELVIELVRESDTVGFWIAVLFFAALGVFLMSQGMKAFWRLRLIRDTPSARVRSAPQGYVELVGTARPLRKLVSAKLTGSTCCWYRWRIEKRRRSGRSEHWVTVDQGELERGFLLDDGTGECIVEPQGALIRCRATERWFGSVSGAARQPSSSVALPFGNHRRYRMTEERVHEGDPLYVMGHHETPRRDPVTCDTLTRTLLKRWKHDPERLRALDRDGDGEVDLREWEHARELAQEAAQQAERRVAAKPARARIVATGDSRRPYLISTEGEAALLGQARWQALGGTLVGTMLGIAALAAAVARLSIAA